MGAGPLPSWVVVRKGSKGTRLVYQAKSESLPTT